MMPAISDLTRSRITAALEVFIENYVEKHRDRAVEKMKSPQQYLNLSDKDGGLKPFYVAIVPSEVLRISAFQRGLVTSVGTSLEECARLIALDHHQDAQRGYVLRGEISSDALSEIERQVAAFEHAASRKAPRASLNSMINGVLRSNMSGETEIRDHKADLYILGDDDVEYYFEMKSPKPNKDQCLRVTQGILKIHALRNQARPNVQCYFAMTYNPFGNSRQSYNWSFARNYTPFDGAVLIGKEFWNIIGGESCYKELLEIYKYVGTVKSKYIVDTLAFGI